MTVSDVARAFLVVACAVLSPACGGGGGPSGPPDLEITPLTLDFGTAALDVPTPLEVTVANRGGGEIALLSVTLTSGDPDVWSVDRSAVSAVAAGQSGAVVVRFEPEETVSYTGALQVRTDAGSESITLRGIGGLPGVDEDGDGFSPADGDCDDDDPDVYPGAEEICDGKDSDCNGIVAAEEADDDGDDWPVCAGDCDDDNDDVWPGAPEICDDLDNDCDGVEADRDDLDNDGFSICGDESFEGPGDCDDLNDLVFPGAEEVCDTFDNDCDGAVDNRDLDGDGRTVCFGAGDCDDEDPAAWPVIVAENGDDEGVGDDADPLETLEAALQNLDGVCNTVIFESGTYEDVSAVFGGPDVILAGRSGAPEDVMLEAPEEARHFDVTAGSLGLRGLTLTGGAAVDNGGSVRVVEAALDLAGVRFDGNTSDADGGAIAITSGGLTVGEDVTFVSNQAGADGGAILLEQSTLTDVLGSVYESNEAAFGGALRIEGGTVAVTDARFEANLASEGGALSAVGNSAGGLTLERVRFWLNEATGQGGAIALRDVVDGVGVIRNNRLQDNEAGTGGGGIAVLGAVGSSRLHNNTLAGNAAPGAEGAAVLVQASDATGLELVSLIAHRNDGASGIFVAAGSGASVGWTTVFGTNSGTDFGGEIGDGDGEPLEATNTSASPELVAFSADGDPANDDLTLAATSPAIDSGPADPAFDDRDGTQNDRGYTGGPAAP